MNTLTRGLKYISANDIKNVEVLNPFFIGSDLQMVGAKYIWNSHNRNIKNNSSSGDDGYWSDKGWKIFLRTLDIV